MSALTEKCIWCGTSLDAIRSSKKVCSDNCRHAFTRWRTKLKIKNQTAFDYLAAVELFHGTHPNPNYKRGNQ